MKIINVPYLNYYIVQSGKEFYHVYDCKFSPVGLKSHSFYECKLLIDEIVFQENYGAWGERAYE